MCLVELKNSPKPIVSCAMNAKSCLANGDIYTNSSLVKKARENVLARLQQEEQDRRFAAAAEFRAAPSDSEHSNNESQSKRQRCESPNRP